MHNPLSLALETVPRRLALALAAALFAGLAAMSGSAPAADMIARQKELLPPPKTAADDVPLPQLTDAEKAYLMTLARQALEFSAKNGKQFAPADVPASLKDRENIAYVSCRLAGRMIESVAGESGFLADNIARAADYVAGSSELGKQFGEEKLANVRDAVIELNILGPGQLLNWDNLADVGKAITPGVHGLAVRDSNKKTMAFKDSVAPVHGYDADTMVQRLVEKAGWTTHQLMTNKVKVTFYRFRSIHLLEQPGPGGQRGYAELFRCAQLIRTDQITGRRVNELIDLIGSYLLYRQMRNGSFSYLYSPTDNQYLPGDNAVRQAAAAWTASRLAQETGEAAYGLAAVNAVAAAKLRYLDETRKAVCVSYPADTPNQEGIGATAMILAAVVDLPDNQKLAALRDKLAAALLAAQRADGSFKVYFAGRDDDGNKFFYPGEALLALMKLHRQTGDPRYLAAVEKSFDYYRDMFDKEPSRSFVPWQAQAWALAYEATGNRKYADYVFKIVDWLVTFQADQSQVTAGQAYPDILGAFVDDDGSGGIGSAAFLEGVVPAYRLARKLNDVTRADKDGRSLLIGARFLDQLTFKPVDAYYCISPKDAVGGLKTSPAYHAIRIDNCQHGVLALLGIRDVLFPEAKKPVSTRPAETSAPPATAGPPATAPATPR